MVKICTGRTETTFESNAIVAYPFHVILLYFTPTSRWFLTDSGYTFAGSLFVCTSTDERKELEERVEKHQFEKDRLFALLCDALQGRMGRSKIILKLKAIHDFLPEILQPINDNMRPGVFCNCSREAKESVTQLCFLLAVIFLS